MRTKHILTALVFPALFAACTADEFNDSITNGSTAERAQLSENFKLNFDGADTRFSAGDPDESLYFDYEVGDTIGGAIADQYNGGDDYKVVNYISTNHPFVRNAAGEWVINHTMVEGNYLFYFPYNENNHSRGAVHYSIPVLQDLTGEDGKFNPKAAVEKYNMGVGLQFLDKEDLSASLTLANIYGYAKLQLKLDNTYAGGEVDKIVLQNNGGSGFALNGQISNEKVEKLFKSTDPEALKKATTTADFSIALGESFYDATLNIPSSVMVAKVPAGTTLKVDAQNNKTFETYIVMPAKVGYNVNVYLYMADGSVYEAENVKFDVLRNKIKTVSENLAHAENAPYVVTSEKDWNEYVALLPKDKKDAEFIIAGDDFSITNDIKYPTNGATIKIEGEVKVSGDDVTMKNVTAGTIVIEEGAQLTTDGTLSATTVENNGKLIVAPAKDENGKVTPYELGTVNNMPGATLVVDKDAQAQFTLYNQIENKEALNHGTVEINGMLTLNGVSVNSGMITNNGSLRGTFTNNGKVDYPQGASADKIKNSFMPTIVNNNEIFATGVVTNNGLVENNKNAEISCSKVGYADFTNNGTIDLADGSRMLITNNNNEVILETLNQANWSIESTQGIVAYSTTASDAGKSYNFESVGKGITKLYVNGSLGIQKMGKVKDIEIAENATLSLTKGLSLSGALTVKEGVDAVIVTENATVSKLTVEKGATVTINKDNNLTATTVENYGIVYVGGTFTTKTTEEDAKAFGGEFRSTSSQDNNIKFGKTDDQLAQENFNNALTALVNAWLQNTGLIGDGQTIDNWNKVNGTAMTSTDWESNVEWVVAAVKAFRTATGYTADQIDGILTNESNATVIETAVNTAKSTADGLLSTAISKMDNTWVGSDVYQQTKAGDTLDKILNGSKSIDTGFAEYINGAATAIAGNNKLLWLSAKSLTKVTSVPAYSYIEIYETADVYKAMKLWKEATDNYKEEDWYKAGAITYGFDANNTSYNTMKRMKNFFNEINKVDTTGDLLLGQELKPLKDYASQVVLKWNYTNSQIIALSDIIVLAQ